MIREATVEAGAEQGAEMRMLLMVTNNQMSLRELYTLAVENHRAGWATSFMSGLPGGAEAIVSAYDAVVYELGPADSAQRMTEVKALRRAGTPVITHLEGREAAARTEELRAVGAQVIPHPVTIEGITQALDALVSQIKGVGRRVGIAERIKRTFSG
ncbi:MAG TPA: hypothetical protein VNL71_17160 [Chloroflexota bacterium]|nr:hypothetical protein [Chloroflexota bacterium]